eukprot:m.306498 g.306498  ORF g.306498 m.306498 type:complete len:165 (+) comp41301_c0_seq1:125-619(+)
MAFVDLRKTSECSDICVTVEGHSLKLHQFPLFARSDYFKALIRSKLDDANSVVLESLPGGLEVMNLVADFCYEIDISSKIHCKNVGPLICGASYLQMVGSNNLLEQAQKKLRLLSIVSRLGFVFSPHQFHEWQANGKPFPFVLLSALSPGKVVVRWKPQKPQGQ